GGGGRPVADRLHQARVTGAARRCACLIGVKSRHDITGDAQIASRRVPMMQLYWSPRSRSFTALCLMEETGQPYERVLTDISAGAQKKAEYLAINPMGKVPALKDGDATLAEAAAICASVAHRHPEA